MAKLKVIIAKLKVIIAKLKAQAKRPGSAKGETATQSI